MRIDAHQHFWKYNKDRHVWMTDEMDSLRVDFTPDDLRPYLEGCGIDGTVAVQADQSEAENEFLLDLSTRHDLIKGIVGWVDFRDEDVKGRLEYYSQFAKIRGFRHVLHDEPQRDYMLRDDFIKGIAHLTEYDRTYDLLIFVDQLDYTLQFVEKFPNLPLVIDHIAKPGIKERRVSDWEGTFRKIAAHENVYCKISGLVTEADWKNWQKEDFTLYIDIVLDAFGIDRVMYGSDWPVCQLAASYEQQFGILSEYFDQLSTDEQARFFGANAIRFYNL